MRKRYHFLPSKRGLQAWDVDRLVALSKDLPRFGVQLTAIFELDEAYWFSGGASEATCRAVIEHARFIEGADLSFPIILSSDGRVIGWDAPRRQSALEWPGGYRGRSIRPRSRAGLRRGRSGAAALR